MWRQHIKYSHEYLMWRTIKYSDSMPNARKLLRSVKFVTELITIRLQDQDFYDVYRRWLVRTRINYHLIEIESEWSNCFSRIIHQTWNIPPKHLIFKQFLKKKSVYEDDCFATRYPSSVEYYYIDCHRILSFCNLIGFLLASRILAHILLVEKKRWRPISSYKTRVRRITVKVHMA